MPLFTPTKNQEIFSKSCEVLAGGVNSPVRRFTELGIDPLVAQRGKGEMIWDEDGNRYIDFCMSWGVLLHGHAPERVIEQVKKQLEKGSSFGISTSIEERIAREIVTLIPGIDRLRFVSSGTEATMTTIRLARAYTQRDLIVKFNGHYHGHADPFLVKSGSGTLLSSDQTQMEGVLQDTIKHTLSLPFNHIEKLKGLFYNPDYSKRIAGVILEPIAANMGVVSSTKPFLTLLRKETERIGALLIFDEVISGFRVNLRGAQALYAIQPDLTCFGKIIGGGFPAAAFGGGGKVMDFLSPLGSVYQAGTLSGNPVAMEAGLETLKLAARDHFYEELEMKTKRITTSVKSALKKKGLSACLNESVGMFTLFWGPKQVNRFEDLKKLDKNRFKQFFKFLYEKGIYFPPSPYEACFISMAHTEKTLEKTKEAILEFIRQV